jgi:hypothetical protein
MASVIVIASATVVIIALSDRLWPLQVAESLRTEMSLRGGGGEGAHVTGDAVRGAVSRGMSLGVYIFCPR